jgi:hypothetical protein
LEFGSDGGVEPSVDAKELLTGDGAVCDAEALYDGEVKLVNCVAVDATVDGCWVDAPEEADVKVALAVRKVVGVTAEPVVKLIAGDAVVGVEPATVAGAVSFVKCDDVEVGATELGGEVALNGELETLARLVAVGGDDEPADGPMVLRCVLPLDGVVAVEFCV